MNISSRYSNFQPNFAHHIVILWSLSKVWIESLHNNSHQRETIYNKLNFFAKLVRPWKSKELECLILIFIYSNSKFKVTCKNEDFECQYTTKEKPSKTSNITFAILPFYQKKIFKLNGHPEYFGIYYSWWNHQMCFKMVEFNIKKCKI